VHRDLRRPNVTLALLWEEYRAATTDGSSCTTAGIVLIEQPMWKS
jgi:hypothetical protein